ncbi:unnamed protein product [Bursaphelenchus xylophilus]|uniref:(pine wood nematode) hypothetical protein n=1 Tax=Bursaphelenchus xylophilus TaxID=6326 RepID=A0A1I7RRW5_BURXY|nr:unnamed protein product [Bursaphelenchus xylophilus]CAG9123431.1 unnamed protein product [Bursaphelenchus xylophilus]
MFVPGPSHFNPSYLFHLALIICTFIFLGTLIPECCKKKINSKKSTQKVFPTDTNVAKNSKIDSGDVLESKEKDKTNPSKEQTKREESKSTTKNIDKEDNKKSAKLEVSAARNEDDSCKADPQHSDPVIEDKMSNKSEAKQPQSQDQADPSNNP